MGKWRSIAPVASIASRTPGDLLGREIVHHDDLAGRERRNQALFEIDEENFTVHRDVVALRNLGDEPLA